MRTGLSFAFVLFAFVGLGQNAVKDTSGRFRFNGMPMDTSGMGDYGMRLYDTRMARWMPVDTIFKQNSNHFVNKKRSTKKAVD